MALLCTFMHFYVLDKVSFSRSKISLISRFEWIISARAGFSKRKLLRLLSNKTLHSGTDLISEFPKELISEFPKAWPSG